VDGAVQSRRKLQMGGALAAEPEEFQFRIAGIVAANGHQPTFPQVHKGHSTFRIGALGNHHTSFFHHSKILSLFENIP
jgi:hypothetical protein